MAMKAARTFPEELRVGEELRLNVLLRQLVRENFSSCLVGFESSACQHLVARRLGTNDIVTSCELVVLHRVPPT